MWDQRVEISVKGSWVKVPAMDIDGQTLVVKGKWIKRAAIHDEDWLETEVADPEVYLRGLRKQGPRGIRADIFTFTQKPPLTEPKFPYPYERESIAAARTVDFEEWWGKLPQETRKNVRRSQRRGVLVRARDFDDELIRGIMEINNESPMRQGRRSRDYGKTFDQVKRDHSSFADRSDFICAYFGNELIGFLKLVYRGKIASILQLLVKASHSDKRPANALVSKAIEFCNAKHIQYVTYGLYNYGNKRESPMREFKLRNGFEEILVPRYYVPLTFWGKVSMKLKLHRGLLGVLPHGAIALGLKARAKWYAVSRRTAGVAQC